MIVRYGRPSRGVGHGPITLSRPRCPCGPATALQADCANPDRYRPGLAQPRNNLAGTPAQFDRPAEAEGGHAIRVLSSSGTAPLRTGRPSAVLPDGLAPKVR